MMITFQCLLKQKSPQVLFENALPASDPGTLEQLKELSSRRRAIKSINQNSFVTEAIAREMSGGLTSRCEQNIQQLEQYLPLLGNLIHHVNIVGDSPKMVQWISGLKIRWSSALTPSSFFHLNCPKLYQMDNLHFELGMTLFVLGALLRVQALEVLSTDLVQSASVLRKAAGVYQHLAQDVLPCLQPELAPERPPEAVISVSAAIAFVCLAEAQAVTVKMAEQKGNTGRLLSKLHYGVGEFLNEAIHTLHSATKQCKDISSLMIHIKKRNRLKLKRLNDLVFIKYNRKLVRRYDTRNTIDPILLDSIDDANEWLTGAPENHEDEEVFEGEDLTYGDVAMESGVVENIYGLRGSLRGKERATTGSTSSLSGSRSRTLVNEPFDDEEEEDEDQVAAVVMTLQEFEDLVEE